MIALFFNPAIEVLTMRSLFLAAIIIAGVNIHPAFAAVENATEPRTLTEKAEQCAFVQQLTDPQVSHVLKAARSGEYVSKDYDEAFKWCHDAAEQGDAPAQTVIGGQYIDGRGVPHDYAQGVKWYDRAANQGYAKSQLAIGRLFDKGIGVKQDDATALFWLILAANGGNQEALAARDEIQSRLDPEQVTGIYRQVDGWKPHPDISQLRGKH